MMNPSTLSDIAHEIRTPLTVIVTQAQLLVKLDENGCLSKQDLNSGLKRLDQEAKRLADLCNQLGSMARTDVDQ